MYYSDPDSRFVTYSFTGHEHLDDFDLINMNGRMYDPLLAMFLSPDNFIQSPGNTQNLNRYAYCLNNPLIYTDPSGEFIFSLLCAIIPGSQPLLPIAIAADIGGTLNAVIHADNIKSFGQFAGYYGIGAAAGAVSTGLGLGLGSALVSGGSFWGGVMGTSTVVSTGFASGFVSGAAGGFAGGFINGFGNAAMNPENDLGDMISEGWNFGWKSALIGGGIGGIAGGIDAVMHDRNFLTGAKKQDMVFQINSQGKTKIMSGKDFDSPWARDITKDHYKTILNENKSLNAGDQIKVKIPKEINKITGLGEKNLGSVGNVLIDNKFITITITNRTDFVVLNGWRWRSNPLHSFKDLFRYRLR